jgi:hypothetical protein
LLRVDRGENHQHHISLPSRINFLNFATRTLEDLPGHSLTLAKRTQSCTQGCRLLLGLHNFIPRLFTADLFSPSYFFLMATMKYDIPLLDRDTRFALWQVKMRAVLA